MSERATLAVLGPGGVGGFVAGALARAGEPVLVLARESTAAVLTRDGLRVRSVRLGDFAAAPGVAQRLLASTEILFVATKATSLVGALERVQGQPRIVVPLLNGLEHISLLRERFGAAVIAGSIRIEADRRAPGVIVQTSPFLRVDLASDDPGLAGEIEELAGRLRAAQVPTSIQPSEAQCLWSKLVRLNALALTTSAADRPVGFIRTAPAWRHRLELAVGEGAAIAAAEGAEVSPETVMGELDAAHATLASSMQRDIAAGRASELDAIAGAVLRAGARHAMPAPTIRALAGEVALRAGQPAPV